VGVCAILSVFLEREFESNIFLNAE